MTRKDSDKEKEDIAALAATLEEYKLLRADMTQIVDRQYPIIYWGISSIAVIIAATINVWDKLISVPIILLLLFFLIVPSLATAYVVTWSHLIIKMARLGSYLYLVEHKIAIIVGKTALPISLPPDIQEIFSLPVAWEHTLWKSNSHEFIFRTCITVKWGMAILYLIMTGIGTFVAMAYVWHSQNISSLILITSIVSIFIFWLVIWKVLFRFVIRDVEKAVQIIRTYGIAFDALKKGVEQ